MHTHHRTLTLLTVLFSLHIHFTQSLPTSTPLPEHPIYSLPPLQPTTTLNGSSESNGNCASQAKYPSWSSSDWVIEDCYAAVQQLYLQEVVARPNVEYEFSASWLSPKQFALDSVRTPRKYIDRKC